MDYLQVADMGGLHWDVVHNSRNGKGWEASLCSGCRNHSLWIDGELAFLAFRVDNGVPAPPSDMPSGARDLYIEAAAVLPHSRRAAAALCRAALERLARHPTDDLEADIKLDGRLLALSRRTTASTTKALLFIRHVGNTALHGAKDGDQSAVIYLDAPEDVPINMLFVTLVELVNELITRPRVIDASFETVPANVRKDFERKAKQLNDGTKGEGGNRPPHRSPPQVIAVLFAY